MSDTIPQDNTPRKQCTACLQWFAATPEFFHRRGDKLKPRCKQCIAEETKIYNATHVEERKNYGKTHREAANIRDKRYREKHPDRKREQWEQYYQSNSEEVLAKHRERYASNQDSERMRSRQYRKNNPKKVREIQANYRENNPEKERARQRRYYQTYPEKGVARAQRYHALKKSLEGQISAQDIQIKLKAQKYACYYCLRKFEKRANGTHIYHLEHTVPVSRIELTPRHDINYVVLACPHCNQSKGGRSPWEWPEGGRLF